jgi:hypothetical protein
MNQTNHESRPGDSCPTILLVPELALACRKRMGLLFPELIHYHNITIIAIISHRTHLELSVWTSVCIFQGKWICNITTKKNTGDPHQSSIRTQPHSKMIQKADCLKIRRKKTRVQNLFTLG